MGCDLLPRAGALALVGFARVWRVSCDLSGQQINTNARHIAITVIMDRIDLHKRYLSLLLSLGSVHFCTVGWMFYVVHHGTMNSY